VTTDISIDLLCGDTLEFLRDRADASVDLTFYDPPFNCQKDYGIYKDDLPPEQYEQWMREVASEAKRISRRGIAVFVGQKQTRLFYSILPDAHCVPVHKRAIGVMDGNWFLQYCSLFVTATPLEKCKDLWDDIRLPGEGYFFREERFDHPGMTSKALVKKILRYFTVPGEIVCDPFFGCGATPVACFEMQRNFVGTELNPTYITETEHRLENARLQMTMGLT
jgi:site-specific DNA-methyltransferase (adenine-specific)